METNNPAPAPSPTSSQITAADPRLTDVVSHFYSVQHIGETAVEQQVMPSYETMLVFNFGPPLTGYLGDEPCTIHQMAVLGPLKKLLRYTLPTGADLIGVNFTLDGFFRLWGKPMQPPGGSKLAQSGMLTDVPFFADLWEQLNALTTLTERIEAISDFIVAHLAPAGAATLSLLDTIPYFRQATLDPIKGVAEAHRVTPRYMQQQFQNHLGYSAKELARFLRFRQLLDHLRALDTPQVDWLHLVQTLGYYDQPHLIRDVQYFLGITPRQFVAQLLAGALCVAPSGELYQRAINDKWLTVSD